jgi:hypothetical protein
LRVTTRAALNRNSLEDLMTTRTCTRRVSVPAYYLGRPAALWLAALAPASTTGRSPRPVEDRSPA